MCLAMYAATILWAFEGVRLGVCGLLVCRGVVFAVGRRC